MGTNIHNNKGSRPGMAGQCSLLASISRAENISEKQTNTTIVNKIS